MKALFLLAFWISSITILYAINPPSKISIEDLILHETREIQEAEANSPANLSLKYLNRAESYIVAGQFEKALEDLEKGHEAAWQLNQKNMEQRTMIDMMVAYAYLGNDEKALWATEHFQNLFYSSDNHKKGRLCKDENYVSGPDDEPAPGWCRQAVDNTADYLIGIVKGSHLSITTQESIEYVINQIRYSGLQCCARGERWKRCVGPLAKRTMEWQVSGVPANPKWD